MRVFQVLVVDDEASQLKSVADAFRDSPTVRVSTAESLLQARERVTSTFFNAAFVDMQLSPTTGNSDGLLVLRELMDLRPSCRRYLWTQHPETHLRPIFDLLHPLNPIIHGALDKQDLRWSVVAVIRAMAEEWLTRAVKVENVPLVLEALRARGVGTGTPAVTIEEVDYVVSRVLGQHRKASGASADEAIQISLCELTGGRSRAVVVLGRPQNSAGREGINCVIKIGGREDSEQEHMRYQKYVRFLVSLNRRVEMLGYASGDSVGGVCYSFAGPSPDRIASLGSLFEKRDDRVFACLEQLFGVESNEWYGLDRPDEDLGSFFSRTHRLEARAVLEEVAVFADRIADRVDGKRKGDALVVGGLKLRIPKRVIGAAILRRRYRSCLVHGDMNGGNVIVADDGRTICIDFKDTGWGPLATDFAAVEMSVRLSDSLSGRSLKDIVADEPLERAAWKQAWAEGGDRASNARAYWARVSTTIVKQYRERFGERASADEYAATCLLWALRLFRIRELTEQARLRLLVWMSSLDLALEEE